MSFSANEVTSLRPETTSRRKLPVNFKPEDSCLFSHELERVIPETRLLKLHNVGVSAEGIVFRGRKMLPESFAFPHTRASWKRRSVVKFFVNNYVLRKRRQFEKEAIVVTNDWSGGYFHWVADVLPRLFTMRDQLKNLVLLLPAEYKTLKYVDASLPRFELGGIEFIDPEEVLICRSLLLPTQTAPSGHYNDELIREVGKLLVDYYSEVATREPTERIYISRALAPQRKILNEDEVLEVLRAFDFRTVRPEDLSFAEQIRVAAQARYLISNHGAGLTNMLFMSAGANVLELRHATDAINNCYFTLAAALNLNYFYQSCEPVHGDEDPHIADLNVDARTLWVNLELLLAT